MDLKEIGWDRIHVAQEHKRQPFLESFLTSWVTISYWRMALFLELVYVSVTFSVTGITAGGLKYVTFCAVCVSVGCVRFVLQCMFPEWACSERVWCGQQVTDSWPLLSAVLYQTLWHRTQQMTVQNFQRYRRNNQVHWQANRRTDTKQRETARCTF